MSIDLNDPVAFCESLMGPLQPWQKHIVEQLAGLTPVERFHYIMPRGRLMSRVDLTNKLNRKWWDEAMDIIASNVRHLNDWEASFVRDMQEIAEYGNPSVKQFNQLREIAKRVKA